jgi:hypothetical protein
VLLLVLIKSVGEWTVSTAPADTLQLDERKILRKRWRKPGDEMGRRLGWLVNMGGKADVREV